MGIINRAKKFLNTCLDHANEIAAESTWTPTPDSWAMTPGRKDDSGVSTRLMVNGHDFGPIYWVETNIAAKTHIIHCKNGDYEL